MTEYVDTDTIEITVTEDDDGGGPVDPGPSNCETTIGFRSTLGPVDESDQRDLTIEILTAAGSGAGSVTVTGLEGLAGTLPPDPPFPVPEVGWVDLPPEGGGVLPALLFVDVFTMGVDSPTKFARWTLTSDAVCGVYTLTLWWWWNDTEQQVEMWSYDGTAWVQVLP